jgi:hypothetical protein
MYNCNCAAAYFLDVVIRGYAHPLVQGAASRFSPNPTHSPQHHPVSGGGGQWHQWSVVASSRQWPVGLLVLVLGARGSYKYTARVHTRP